MINLWYSILLLSENSLNWLERTLLASLINTCWKQSEKRMSSCGLPECKCLHGGDDCHSLQDLNEDPHTHKQGCNCPLQQMSDNHEYFMVLIFTEVTAISLSRPIHIYSKCGLIGTCNKTGAISQDGAAD